MQDSLTCLLESRDANHIGGISITTTKEEVTSYFEKQSVGLVFKPRYRRELAKFSISPKFKSPMRLL